MTTTSYRWKRVSKGWFRSSSIELYSDDLLIGIIPDVSLRKTAEINGKKFFIPRQSEFSFSFPKPYRMQDPDTGFVWCELSEHPGRKKFAKIAGKTYDVSVYPDDNPAQTNGLVMQGYNDRLFSYSSGRLEIRTDRDIEILALCYFFVCYLRYLDSF